MLGSIGMVLCVPLTMTLKFACENNKSTQWIAVLLGREAAAENILPVLKKGSDPEIRTNSENTHKEKRI
jgi:hypothetical protein